MKTPSTDLFNLIQSLTTQEKVYFKQYASRKKGNTNYILLFNAISKQKKYDEIKLKSKLEKESFIKNLESVKRYLTTVILKSLQDYYSSDSINAQLCNEIQQIQILIKKRLFKIAKKKIVKAKKVALDNYKHSLLSIILSLQNNIMILEANMEEISKYPSHLYEEEIACVEQYKTLIDYTKIGAQVGFYSYSQHPNTPELKKLIQLLLLKKESTTLPLPVKLMHYTLLGDIYFLLNKWEDAYINYKIFIQSLEEHPLYLKNNGSEKYVGIVSNLLAILFLLRKSEEITFTYNKITSYIKALSPKQQSNNILKLYNSINNNYIGYLLSVFQIKEALKHSQKSEKSIEKYGSLNIFIVYHFNFCLIYFYQNNFNKALFYCNKILNKNSINVRQDLVDLAKILIIFIHYELRNIEVIPYLRQQTKAYLKKMRPLKGYETILLSFFCPTILKIDSEKEKIEAFIRLKENLTPMIEIMNKNIINDFDIIAWVDSKIEKCSFLEVAKEHNLERNKNT